MKAVLILLTLVAVAIATSDDVTQCKQTYSHRPEDYDPLRDKYIFFEDERGFYFEDLTKSKIELEIDINHVTLFLYTRYNPANGELIKIKNLDHLLASKVYDPTKRNYFISHGFRNDGSSDLNVIVKRQILLHDDVNVFVVDWGVISYTLNYYTARSAVPEVGGYVGNFIIDMIDHFNLKSSDFRLIGHSLGAHVSGHIGDRVKLNRGYVDYIIGLDPAGPLFSIGNRNNRLDEYDAAYVQVIYTSTWVLGWGAHLGHTTFFSNGGSSQPGCGVDPIGTCAHSRAYSLFAESIEIGGFTSRLCESYEEYEKGNCNDNQISYFGRLQPDKSACGRFHFKTKGEYPFSYG